MQRNEVHFHCLKFRRTITRKNNYVSHLEKLCEPYVKGDNVHMPQTCIKSEEHVKYVPKAKLHASCPEFGRDKLAKNIKRHLDDVHQKNKCDIDRKHHHRGIMVHVEEVIFMVSKAMTGVPHPIHVQVKTGATNQAIDCENDECVDALKASPQGSNVHFECSHVRSGQYLESSMLPHVGYIMSIASYMVYVEELVKKMVWLTLPSC